MGILSSSCHRIRITNSGLFGVRFSISCVYIPPAASFTCRVRVPCFSQNYVSLTGRKPISRDYSRVYRPFIQIPGSANNPISGGQYVKTKNSTAINAITATRTGSYLRIFPFGVRRRARTKAARTLTRKVMISRESR